MAVVDKALIQKLREITGLGMLDCKKALEQADNDIEKAVDLLRKQGAAVAAKRSARETAEGFIHAYIHPGNRVGVLIELNCETDFVARTQDVAQLAQDLCLHIAALKPLYLAPEDVDAAFIAHERDVFLAQMQDSGKPEKIVAQIIEGKLQKLYSDICLLKQAFVKNDQLTVDDVVKQLAAKTGENIRIKRFARYEIGA